MSKPALAGRPNQAIPVPDAVMQLAGDDPLDLAWRNELGGLTYRAGAGSSRDRYVKWVRAGTAGIDLHAEAGRLEWLAGRVPVPKVLEVGSDEAGMWLVTVAIAATSAVQPRWLSQPATSAAAIGTGLRALHDRLPVLDCPFRWDVEDRLRRAWGRLDRGEGPERWFPEHHHLSVEEAWDRLAAPPPIDRLVVCHGDACAPNTLVDDDGRFAAHVDLGHLGLADRWADLAVAAWSTEWNYGPGFDTIVYAAYGILPDHDRIAYYRLLWDLS